MTKKSWRNWGQKLEKNKRCTLKVAFRPSCVLLERFSTLLVILPSEHDGFVICFWETWAMSALCDMNKHDAMQWMGTHPRQERRTQVPGPHQVIDWGVWWTAIVYTFNCARGSRAARMDDCDDSERSLDLLLLLRLPKRSRVQSSVRVVASRVSRINFVTFSRNHLAGEICRHRIVHNYGSQPCMPES